MNLLKIAECILGILWTSLSEKPLSIGVNYVQQSAEVDKKLRIC